MRSRLLALALAMLCALTASAAVAADPPVVLPTPATGRIESPAEALEEDAGQYAAAYGIDLAEAATRLAALDASVADTDRLAALYRDRLAGIAVEHRPTLRIVVLLAGDAPAMPTPIATAGGVPVVIETGAPATRAQLLNAIALHQADLRAALASPPGLGVDARTGRLAVIVQPGELGSEGADALTARLAAIATVPVEVRTWVGPDENSSLEGGGRLVGRDDADGRRYVCTTGFAVTDGARAGLTTAAHCPDLPELVDRTGQSLPATLVGAWGAGDQDVQIATADASVDPLFYVDRSARVSRPVGTWRNRASLRAGDFVCHRGERTGYSCSEIEFVDYAPAGDLCAGPCPPSWVAAKGPHCGGGDSGGPVFRGTTALGIFKGGSYAADGTCAVYYFMSTDFLPAGWTVLREGGEAVATGHTR